MRCRWTWILLLGSAAAGADDGAGEDQQEPAVRLEEVTIVGTREEIDGIAGAAHRLDKDTLARFSHADVQRIVRQVPGVSVQVEDGYGLRPNISIRGVATERSARITLLEDGVLIAPAPYSAPSAYYFPTPGRMTSFEVLKGPSAITQGPYTIGGAFNMISTPIPVAAGVGEVLVETGQHGTGRLHASYGGTHSSGFGYLLETHRWISDGFQTIDRSRNDTGLDVRDYTVKLAVSPPGSPHGVELKLQFADQTSNQSYLGLTDADFRADPLRRYGLSALDRIDTQHEQAILRYEYAASDTLRLTATAYNNRHARNWFKTEGIDVDGSVNAEAFSRTSWSSVVQAVNRAAGLGGFSAGELGGILRGELDTPPGSIQVRSNDRRYDSRGVQVGANWMVTTRAASHTLRVGVRYHEDEEDRLQRNSAYRQRDGRLHLDDLGQLGNAGNRIQRAEAVALFVQDRIEFGAWTLTPGLRYEDIDQQRIRYETRAGRTADPSSRTADNLRSTRRNRTRVLLPGLGAVYRFGDGAALIAGVHKGFTAPSNAPDVEPEEALNYEFGLRLGDSPRRLEAVAFLSDYDNLLGECTSSSGADCEAGDAFNGDAATVRGLEFKAATELTRDAGFAVPLEVVYTYIDGRFDTDIADTDFFGDVNTGDPIPYVPQHQLHAMIGVLGEAWSAHLSANFVAAVCVRASCGAFEKTDQSLTFDVAGRFPLNDSLALFARVDNLADTEDIVGRHPYGARPNRGRTAMVGLQFDW